MKPDIHDRQNYCQSCKTTYQTFGQYQRHHKVVHYMILKQVRDEAQIIPTYIAVYVMINIQPDQYLTII